jgi:hypothetical protein
MDVRFGRQGDGQPQGTPDKNVLLNVFRINGVDVRLTICQGYIIRATHENGVTVGITRFNTVGFHNINLAPGINHATDSRDWAAVPMAVSVNGSPYVPGSAVIDTGIDQARTNFHLVFLYSHHLGGG